jgi:hypothetical protein
MLLTIACSTRLGISELPGRASSEERPLTDETRSPDAMRAKLAVREWELHLYELGRLTKLEADTAIAPELVQEWREEIDELRRVADAS